MHPPDIIERYNRGTRLLHAAIYLGVLIDLASGWWFVLASYRPSLIEELTGIGDSWIHEYTGIALIPVAVIGCGVGWRAVRTFTAESLRFRSSDVRWFRRWPRSVRTGRFEYHDGHFDPGQRLANIVMVLTLTGLLVTGVGALYLPGPFGLTVFQLHRWSAFLITPVLLGHIVIAAGILPGYRGAWRSMHLGGRLPAEVARRIWPGWLDRERQR
jgi:cytochrome b subunit of formate dehydrogenase